MSRILLVGDSITVGYPPVGGPGFRGWLFESTPEDTYVGPFESPKGLFHGGSGGATTFTFLNDTARLLTADGWLTTFQPDIVRIQLGTNDLASFPEPVERVVDRITSIVATGAARLPKASWHISSIPLGGGAAFQDKVRAYNAALLNRITKKGALNLTAPHASFRDNCIHFNRVFDAEGLTSVLTPPPDATHPNARGYALIAQGILEQRGKAISAALRSAAKGLSPAPGTPVPVPSKPTPPPIQSAPSSGGSTVLRVAAVGAGAYLLYRYFT